VSAGDKLLLEGHRAVDRARASTSRWSGTNGAGKTTLIETLAGARELERGKLRRGTT
jgi:ABC-type branched-subunit amino acid transport system ATPase component